MYRGLNQAVKSRSKNLKGQLETIQLMRGGELVTNLLGAFGLSLKKPESRHGWGAGFGCGTRTGGRISMVWRHSSVMADQSSIARIESVLQELSSGQSLLVLAQTFKAEGMSQLEMYQLFDKYRAKHEADTDETKYDAILDTLDIICGWRGSHARLFDTDLRI
jgi:hypothetical protein